jgi:tetratricopeptide (TPR) repeat protein
MVTGSIALERGDLKSAGKNLLAAWREVKTRDDFPRARILVLTKLAMFYIRLRSYVKAARYLNEALEISEEQYGGASEATADVLVKLADLYGMQGKYRLCAQFYLRALKAQEKGFPKDSYWLSCVSDRLARAYYAQGKKVKAEHWQAIARATEIK